MLPLFRLAGFRLSVLALAALSALAGCAVGPDYVKPQPPPGATLAEFKEGGLWKSAAPGQVDADGPWWRSYGDPQIDALVEQANHANQTLQQAEAQYRQAQSLVQGAQAAWYPTVGVSAGVSRARTNTNGNSVLANTHAWSLQAAWEPDLWGGVRRAVEAANAGAAASAADLAAARLAIQASLVNNYLQLRLSDRQRALFARTIAGYEKSLKLTESQYRAGVVTRSDVALASTTLNAARAQAIDVELTRRQLEHALAVLLGKTPAEFSLAAAPDDAALPAVPAIPVGVPSQLLERRPDIAGAERRMAQANANIGVAQAAYYPSLSLTGSDGNSGRGLGSWLAAPSAVWALGASLAANLFDGGLRNARTEQARAVFDASAAAYRQTVLAGFQDVEDNLGALGDLARERAAQDEAVRSARESETVLLSQYRAGTATYLAVITAQALALTNERTALQLQGRQMAASVALIKAVGGGWGASQLQTRPLQTKPPVAAVMPAAMPTALTAATTDNTTLVSHE